MLKKFYLIVQGLIILLTCGTPAVLSYDEPTITVEENIIEAVPYNAIPEIDRRIIDLDVEKLSKYAFMLRKHHMVRLQFAPTTKKGITSSVFTWSSYIDKASLANNLPSELIQAVIEVESGEVADAVSHCGAQGLMQLMPETQDELGVTNAFDPDENIAAGSRYLAMLIERYSNDMNLALAAYNAGMGNVDRYKGIPPFKETENFVRKVTRRYQQLLRQPH